MSVYSDDAREVARTARGRLDSERFVLIMDDDPPPSTVAGLGVLCPAGTRIIMFGDNGTRYPAIALPSTVHRETPEDVGWVVSVARAVAGIRRKDVEWKRRLMRKLHDVKDDVSGFAFSAAATASGMDLSGLSSAVWVLNDIMYDVSGELRSVDEP